MAVASAVVDDESTSLYGSAGTVDTINYDVKKSLLDKLTQLRRKLFGGHRLDEVVTTRLKSIHRAIKFGLGFADSNPDKGSERYDCVQFSCIEDFTACAEELIQQLLTINSDHENQLVPVAEIESTRQQLHNKTVFLSFYGQYNSGKSTILNCILRNLYLPVNTRPTTSITLLISPTHENEEFTDGLMRYNDQIEGKLSNDILQNCLMKNDKYMAHGVEQIYSTLKTVNERARDPNNAEIRNCQYHLKAKFQLPLNVPSGWKVYFMDNPGFDEYSPHVAEVAMRGQGLSSATLYITTFEQHRQVNTTGFIQSMYQKNNDIFKERRLIIVVNKLDKTCYNSTSLDFGEDDEEKTPEDITSEVHEFIVKICKCHPEDIPRDIIIPMCGLWAYRARKLARMPGSHKCRDDVVRALCAVKSLPAGQEESRESCYVSLPSQEIASHLESLAGICELERKLQDMAKSSILVWIRKISHDFDMFLQGSFKKLSRRIETLTKKQKEDNQDIENELEVMQEIYEMYDEISKIPADEQLIQRFKESFSEDMQELNLRDMADRKVQKKLKEFQDRLKDAVKVRKYYGPEEFLQDLKFFIQELSASLKSILNSSFTKMQGTCSQEFHKITCKVARLGTKLESSSLAFDNLLKKEVKCVIPKIKGPEVEKALRISLPILGERLQDKLWGKCQDTVSTITKKFPSLNMKAYLADFYDNKHYFIEAYEGSDEDCLLFDSQHSSIISIQNSDISLRNDSTAKEFEHSEKNMVTVDLEKNEGSSDDNNERDQALTSSGSISHQTSSSVDAMEEISNSSLLATMPTLLSSASAEDQCAILPVQNDSISVNSDRLEEVALSGSPTLSTKCSSQDDASSGVSSDQETPSSARRKRGFRKLSELENVFGELQDSLTTVAQDYFNNLEVIVLEEFSISYYEAAINYLKNFEESYRGLLDMKTQEMNSRLYQLLTDTKKLEDDGFQRSQLTYMRTQFAFISQKYQKPFFSS